MEKELTVQDWNMVSEVELVYKSKVKASKRPLIKRSDDVAELLRLTWDENKMELQEQLKVILLNRNNRVLGIFEAFTGGIAGVTVDVRLIFTAALKLNACGIVIAHNHPSGALEPSQSDKIMTQKVKEAGLLMEISLMDHIIITTEGFYSFADEGLL